MSATQLAWQKPHECQNSGGPGAHCEGSHLPSLESPGKSTLTEGQTADKTQSSDAPRMIAIESCTSNEWLVQYINCISIKLFKFFFLTKKKKRCPADKTMGRAELRMQWGHHAPSSQPPGCSRNTGVAFLARGLAFGYALPRCMYLQ